jgi:hypothetical protein
VSLLAAMVLPVKQDGQWSGQWPPGAARAIDAVIPAEAAANADRTATCGTGN